MESQHVQLLAESFNGTDSCDGSREALSRMTTSPICAIKEVVISDTWVDSRSFGGWITMMTQSQHRSTVTKAWRHRTISSCPQTGKANSHGLDTESKI